MAEHHEIGMRPGPSLVRLHPHPGAFYVAQGRTVFATDLDGFISGAQRTGLFTHETRVLSKYRYLINGKGPLPVVLSSCEQHTWMGYYIETVPGAPFEQDHGSGHMEEASEKTLELRLSRHAGPGVHEDVDLTNFGQKKAEFELSIEVDADFAGLEETAGDRKQHGQCTREWRRGSDGVRELAFDYHASHQYDHQGNVGTAEIHRGMIVRIEKTDSPAEFEDGCLKFSIALEPHQSWHACMLLIPVIEGNQLRPDCGCVEFTEQKGKFDQSRDIFLSECTRFSSPCTETLEPLVVGVLNQAKHDLAALRLYDLDQSERAWTVAAGLPLYIALFGRDTLGASWQASILGPEMMKGTLAEIEKWQGTEINDWRDEEPGRMIHEAHSSPTAMLCYNPHGRYYGSATTSSFYPFVVSELWHWTGDKDLVRPLIDPSLRALAWKETRKTRGPFYEYETHSTQGVKNQGWKDSGDAIVYDDGSQVDPPIGTCEEQAFVYAAKLQLAEVLWWFDKRETGTRLYHEAQELKKSFNETFWMEDRDFFAMGLDGQGNLIKSIASNPGHCMAAGIVDESLIERTARRLMADDLFSGWGVRTLSSDHPAFDPFSYHRGSVWPVEQGSFAIGFWRAGMHDLVHKLCRAIFEAASLFTYYRLPEVFSGHARDAAHPFPALYPKANSLQAWSASATFCLIQAILGIYPYAPLKLLFLDPHLPEWLPRITVERLRVGNAHVSIRFSREQDGTSNYEIIDIQGDLHVFRQPSPWSLTAGYGERVKDVLMSFLPTR